MKKLILLICLLWALPVHAELREMQWEEVSTVVVPDFADKGLLLVESTIPKLMFKSTNPIRPGSVYQKDDEPGIWYVKVELGVNVIDISAEGFVTLTLPRHNFKLRETWKLKVTPKTPLQNELPVMIRVEPDGASVKVDGKSFDLSGSLKLAIGEHDIIISKSGYTTIRDRFTVNEDNIFFEYTLEKPKLSVVEVRTDPPGAEVSVDNFMMGSPGNESGGNIGGSAFTHIFTIPYSDNFSSDVGWTNKTSGDFTINGGQLNWNVDASIAQYMYIPISKPFSGDFQMDFNFQLKDKENNSWLEVGLAESLSGSQPSSEPTGTFIRFGWMGGGTPHSAYYVIPFAAYSDKGNYTGGFHYSDPSTYIAFTEDEWYSARIEVVGLNWRLTVENARGQKVEQKTGTFPALSSTYKYIYIGNPTDKDWPESNGYLDNLNITGQVKWDGE